MAEPSSDETRSNSLTKVPEKSPKKKSSNPLTKLLRRRSSRKHEEGEASSPDVVDSEPIEEEAEDELEKDPSLVEEVKQVVETAFHDLIHRKKKKDTSLDHSSKSRDDDDDSSSESSKESKHDYLSKFKDGFGKAKEGLKEEYDKAKDEIKSILNKDKSQEEHHQQVLLEQKPTPEINTEKKPLVEDEEVRAPNLVQRLQEEVVAVVSTIDNSNEGKTSQEESKENKEEKKEDNCITSLAQGLQNLCSWGSKKED